MTYKIKFTKRAKKFIEKQPKNHRERIYKAIYKLPKDDVKKIKGITNLYRLRVGDYRIIYDIIDDELYIEIINADNRGDIYKNY